MVKITLINRRILILIKGGGFQIVGNNQLECEAPGSLPSSDVKGTSSVSTGVSKRSRGTCKVDRETCSLDYDISWEDLAIGEKIGQVALKLFLKLDYSDDLLHSFRHEVVLFIGAVASPQHLCIVTEFLPRGNLYQMLQRSSQKLDWRRRVLMALDIRSIMCSPSIHFEQVGDFGLSKFKHQTFMSTLIGRGMFFQPQWMAPEVLCNDRSDEKSDVYSYGVILWEIATQKIPWDNYNSMQIFLCLLLPHSSPFVIGAVGFMNRRLDTPKEMDPGWVSIIGSCWQSDPKRRPTFRELLVKLKHLQRLQAQASRLAHGSQTTTPPPDI
ncbi:hypothetical protein MKX01_028857 [Papaver californicum]|nr:hypothetical protein MKX01_028857 [Papaver californicum]